MKARWAFAGGILLGFIVGAAVASAMQFRIWSAHASVQTSGEAAFRVNSLALMRIGDTQGAIMMEETLLDGTLASLAQTNPDPTKLGPDELRSARMAKFYREVYPWTNPQYAAIVDPWLQRVPGELEMKPDSKSGLARMKKMKEEGTLPGAASN